MNGHRHGLVLLLLLGLAVPATVFPCSSIAFPNKGLLFFGTNYDNYFAPGQVFVNKRGVRKSGWETGTTGQTAQWVSRYGSVTISCAGYQLAWGGMNEEGLCFSTMLLNGTRAQASDHRPALAGALWWQYMLDTCATIDEVRKASKDIRITDTDDHYLACDRTGDVAVIECLGGRLTIRSGSKVPVHALANAPYQECLDHWTSKAAGPESPYDSLNRFSRLAEGMAAFKEGGATKAVDYAFGLLAGVASSNTRWSFVCDTGNRVFYLKSCMNPKLRFIDLKKIDFACGRPTLMMDAHAAMAGDITSAFHPYSHDEALGQILKAIAYFRPEMSPDRVRQLLALFEGFSCETEKR